jgi:arabinose-5-phosphate isomerase
MAKMGNAFNVDYVDERLVARHNLEKQGRAVEGLAYGVGIPFSIVVDRIASTYNYNRIVVFSGVGKSGLVGRYLAACLNAIGVSSVFLSPSEAVHGDLGVLHAAGVLVVLSVSGNTKELKPVMARARNIQLNTYLITAGDEKCPLAAEATGTLFLPPLPEIDPSGMLPLKASLMQMALGNAIIAAVSDRIEFSRERLAYLHPGGAIGEALKESAG